MYQKKSSCPSCLAVHCVAAEFLGSSNLFDVQEVFGLEGYGHALHGDVVAGAGVVADICPHSKRHWFGLRAATEKTDDW